MGLSYLFLALILCLPVLVLIIMTKIKEMHAETLKFLRDTQVVGGEPRALVEVRQALVQNKRKMLEIGRPTYQNTLEPALCKIWGSFMDMRLVTKTKLQENGCLEWQGSLDSYGYAQFRVNGKSTLVHRYVWQQHNGPITSKQHVCHSCDNPKCLNLNHMFLGSHKDNMRDMWSKGRGKIPCKRGASHGISKLTEPDIILIKGLLAARNSQASIASLFNVAQTCISHIATGKTWRHV